MRKRKWWEVEVCLGRWFYLHTFLVPRGRRLTLKLGKEHLLATWGSDA